ncbi:MAG: hypothetical protein JNJ59_08570 [Deltaproteobacteria bacterium]|nr:hypothetical protein [Deltaproteobacteria bacterium]
MSRTTHWVVGIGLWMATGAAACDAPGGGGGAADAVGDTAPGDDTRDTGLGDDSDTGPDGDTRETTVADDTGTPDTTGPATCSDNTRNQTESDVDCGGPCAPCRDGLRCGGASDCQSGSCAAGTCAAPALSCTDGQQSGDESDLDCGGSCPVCATGKRCGAGRDCAQGVCKAGLCADPTCDDGVKNGFEADIDCGPGCAACATGRACQFAQDCQSGICSEQRCVSCSDGVINGTESDVDCGGNRCAKCDQGERCGNGADCQSGGCEAGICVGCANGRRDGSETDVDCGGSCAPCGNGKVCGAHTDCQMGTCVAGRCATPSCTDGLQNGTESDIDCGGSCAPCQRGRRCEDNDDCSLATACDTSASPKVCRRPRVTQIGAGDYFTCALLSERGQVACWGLNEQGQLGQTDQLPREVPTVVPGLGEVAQLSVGAGHACVVERGGAVKCWGNDWDGQSGDGSALSVNLSPVTVPGLSATAVSAGSRHTCAIAVGGALKCWGYNGDGQLGTGDVTSSLTPVTVSGASSGVTQLSAGVAHTCARFSDNKGYCWGDNSDRQVARFSGPDELAPKAIAGVPIIAAVAGGRMSCIVQAGGHVSCFGWNNGSNAYLTIMTSGGADVDCGGSNCCAARGASGVTCWVNAESNVLQGVTNATKVAVGLYHICAIDPSGAVLCGGTNQYGEVGHGEVGFAGEAMGGVVGLSD